LIKLFQNYRTSVYTNTKTLSTGKTLNFINAYRVSRLRLAQVERFAIALLYSSTGSIMFTRCKPRHQTGFEFSLPI